MPPGDRPSKGETMQITEGSAESIASFDITLRRLILLRRVGLLISLLQPLSPMCKSSIIGPFIAIARHVGTHQCKRRVGTNARGFGYPRSPATRMSSAGEPWCPDTAGITVIVRDRVVTAVIVRVTITLTDNIQAGTGRIDLHGNRPTIRSRPTRATPSSACSGDYYARLFRTVRNHELSGVYAKRSRLGTGHHFDTGD